jgi:hypothetical protein
MTIYIYDEYEPISQDVWDCILTRRRTRLGWTFWTFVLLPIVFILAPLGLTALCLWWRA